MANFAKLRVAICEILHEILQNSEPLLSPNTHIPRPLGVVVLTENTSKCKEFIVTCNMKTHYTRPLMMKIS